MIKRFKWVLFVSILIGAVGLISGCSDSNKDVVTTEENYTPVEIALATKESIANTITLNGKVIANEEVAVIPKAVGVVSSVNVSIGDVVKKDAILFTIDKEDISRNVAQAANGVELAKKGVAQAENGLNSANINYDLNIEKIENAKLNLERMEILYKEGAISKSQLEQAELSASEKSVDALKGGVNQAEISYQQSSNQLRQAELSYEQAASGLDNAIVKAPISGVVSALNVHKGQIATNSQPAVTIIDKDMVYLQINVVENMVNKLTIGQEVEINVSAAFDEYISGTIDYISPTADPRSQLYPIKIYVENKDKGIRPGMTGVLRLNIDQVESAIVIKSNAVLDKDGKSLVYVVEGDKAVEKEVVTGLDTGDYIEIKSGIIEGEKVIIEGQHYIENGGKVKVVRGD